MATVWRCNFRWTPTKFYGVRCEKRPTSGLLRVAVSGITEVLRLFSSFDGSKLSSTSRVRNEKREEMTFYDIDDVIMILSSDYGNSYFVTGNFTSSIYAEDCIFEDPTIQFSGKERVIRVAGTVSKINLAAFSASTMAGCDILGGTGLYERNLRLLVPFFDNPSISLQRIEKASKGEADFIYAEWKLRTYLKLPWRPLISIDGSTVYELDNKLKIVRHAERWSVSAWEAVAQIFTAGSGREK